MRHNEVNGDSFLNKLEFMEIKNKEIDLLRHSMNERFLRTQKLMRIGLKDVRVAIEESENRTSQKIDELRVDVYGKIDELRVEMNGKFEEVNHKFEEVNHKFEEVHSRIDELKSEVSELNKRVTRIESDTSEIKSILIGMASMFKEKFKE